MLTASVLGSGLDWAGPNHWQVKAHIATAIGGKPALAGETGSTRAWVEVRKAL